MSIILFVFGLPGSGKSAAARHIKSFARRKKFQARRFKDYGILYRMCQEEQKAGSEVKRFRSIRYLDSDVDSDGFDVLDLRVFDEASQRLHHNIQQRKKLTDDSRELIIIEFSRVDYCEHLTFFSSLPLHEAHFLFINSDDIKTCKARIKARAKHPQLLDNRYVPDDIFDRYYQKDHRHYTETARQLNQRFGTPRDHIHVIHNGPDVTVQQFFQAVEAFADDILKVKV